MKIVYHTEYYNRQLYIVKIKNKYLMVYKSSGLSGTGHKNKLFPFMFLSENNTISVILGYIYKEMLYDKKYINHHKNLIQYPKVKKLMIDISKILPKDLISQKNEKINYTKIHNINKEIKTIINNNYFDLKLDLI